MAIFIVIVSYLSVVKWPQSRQSPITSYHWQCLLARLCIGKRWLLRWCLNFKKHRRSGWCGSEKASGNNRENHSFMISYNQLKVRIRGYSLMLKWSKMGLQRFTTDTDENATGCQQHWGYQQQKWRSRIKTRVRPMEWVWMIRISRPPWFDSHHPYHCVK